MPKHRVLVVDDAVVMRRLLTVALEREPDIEVVGSAPNGRIALQKLTQVNPDIVTLDVEMPELNGLETLRALRHSHPDLPVIMFSATTRQGAAATLDALAAGANDYITKPTDVGDLNGAIANLGKHLVPRIRQFCEIAKRRFAPPPPPPAPAFTVPAAPPPAASNGSTRFAAPRGKYDLLCISASTGGPNALAELFSHFTVRPQLPIAIVQHMPPMFTSLLAERLNQSPGPLGCVEATDGMVLEPGVAALAPGGYHLALQRDANRRFIARINQQPPENSCRPAADVMLRTAAQTGARILSVVMTGMGCDGTRGCSHVHEAGGSILIQDQATSTIWGMPGAVAASGLPYAEYPLGQLASQIERHLNRHPVLVA
ncbi:chemotaxis-specific protein-glutamate methyltransferase CheB [Actomonas aquatica]|uniref:Protein-glutamate methylesterase/protein-glutamine glutaminase n=1 Tax=Actomonas aquatica TaxID=2866162 RepID=A0ABZ1CGN2_9BACT|nr:chemotaxis-specific protein-glutamate methyltransferase CheB [Opitutus sp. WL0086]WRQ89430.1 chemotaxis-specific protein-glutamate methyltransferase CheB [Opitutus sp. WL0086]